MKKYKFDDMIKCLNVIATYLSEMQKDIEKEELADRDKQIRNDTINLMMYKYRTCEHCVNHEMGCMECVAKQVRDDFNLN